MIRAIVGAGGKTTLLKTLATQFRSQGKTVFACTSTHMYIEADTMLTDDPAEIICALKTKGYVLAGIPEGIKIRQLSPETYRAVCEFADEVLIEADGSKHLPIKFPREGEPVIYENVEEIIIVCGLHALGRPLKEAAHRLELAKSCLGVPEDTIVTPVHIQKLVVEGYVNPLRQRYPDKKITICPSHDGSAEQMEIAAQLRAAAEKA